MKRLTLITILCCIDLISRSQQLSLIKDINPGSGGSNVSYLTQVNNLLFFAANNGINGMELWRSDGTEAGTVLVKDINAGSSSSSIGYLVNVDGILFFVANNGTNGVELWKSDGTAAGTGMVKDIRPGSMGSSPTGLVNINGILYFAANDGVYGTELWKSDGTESGTLMVKDINPFSGSSYPKSIAAINNTVFFSADDGTKGAELWKSDGTAAGTVLVKEIRPGASGGYPFYLVNVNGTLFFSANNGSNGTELWKSDGTAAGTVLVKDIWNGNDDSNPAALKNINGVLFFSADNGSNGSELWKSDGTSTGTVMVKDVWPGLESGAVGNFSAMINQLIFTGNDGINGYKTWQSDGSVSGTKIATIVADPPNGTIQELTATFSHVFASILEPTTGKELWGAGYAPVLPLLLIEFKGKLQNNDGMLNWTTDQENNTASFILERSVDASNYFTAGNVPAANSPGIHHYSFSDRNIVSFGVAIIYYRLKQINADGTFTYSEIVTIAVSKRGNQVFLYPNPTQSDVHMSLNISQSDNIRYRIVDASGKIIQQESKPLTAGTNNVTISTRGLSSGVYYISLQGTTLNRQLSFVKQ